MRLFDVRRTKGRALVVAALLVCSYVAVYAPQAAYAATSSDNFARADGPLGPNWTDMTDGGMTIESGDVAGGSSSTSGDMWTAQTFGSDQFSEVETTSAPLTGGEWIGPSVRSQDGGASEYVGIYYWNSGSPELMLFKRIGDAWTQLGGTYDSGTLAAGTTLELMATGTTITFVEDGTPCITVSDSSLTGGAPGIMAYGTGEAADWSGGDVTEGTPESVGGTISGLSGTVVLADNTSDQLTVSANGPFTFATQVPQGLSYQVIVQQDPPDQTCTVTNGTGTVGTTAITNVIVTCVTEGNGTAADDFDRADGPLGPDWTDATEGGLAISSDEVVGTNASSTSGDMRTGEDYNNNQYSEIQVTSTQLTGSEWIGASVRVQDGGQDGYVGIYFWNNGSPELMLFDRTGSSWDQIGSAYMSGALPAGTTLRLMVVGSTLSFLENGVERIAGYDPTYTGGDPGIMVNGNGTVGSWSGGTAGFEVHYLGTDANGVQSYDMISANNGYGPQVLRVLTPTDPAPGVPHNFIYTLPVQPGADNTTFGDGLDTLEALNAQNQYNLTIIEPSFGIDPWYANDPLDPNEQEETFVTTELVPWVMANLSTTGTEQNWLIGLSKSGYGGMDLLLKHPNLFTLGAFWDFPADMSSYDELGSDPATSYGTEANFQTNYQLTQGFVDTYKTPFLNNNRIWLGGYSLYEQDMEDFDALLTSEGIPHTLGPMQDVVHSWTSGWVPAALAALAQDSASFTGPPPETNSPTVPTGLTATTVGQTSVNLSWQPSSDNVGVTGYDIYRNGVLLATTTGTSYTDTTVTQGSSYQYAVAAFDAAGNVSAQSTPVTVTLGQSSQSISFAAPASGVVGGSATLAATGGPSGNPVVFTVDTSSGAGVCNVSGTNGTTVNYTAPGSCVIDANQAANANYSAAPQVQATIAVGVSPQAISFSAPATGTVGGSATLAATGGASGNPVVFSVDASSGAGVCNVSATNGTTVNYTAPGSCVIDANQAANANYSAAPQVQATIAVKSPANQAPAITSAASASATVGTAFSFTVTTTGYPTPTVSRTGTLPTGVTFTANSNGTATFSGTPTKSGSYTETITASNGVGTKATQALVIAVDQAPAITSAASASATVGTAFSFSVKTTGYPTPSISDNNAGLPAGLSFTDNGNGTATISGTPSAGSTGVYNLTITASNGTGQPAAQSFALTVNQAPAITSAASASATVGTAFSFTVTTTGYPTPTVSRTGTLPTGVTFTANSNGTATFSGTPTKSGSYTETITASNGVGTKATQALVIAVDQAPAITSAASASATVGTAFSFSVKTTGYPTPSISDNNAGLPAGLSFTDNGNGTATISGTPSAGSTGVYNLTITASNGTGQPAAQSFALTVNQAPAITSAASASATVGTAFSFTVTTTGYPTPTVSRTGTLPTGVTFTANSNGTATFSGTPTKSGSYTETITASNGVGTKATQALVIRVG